MCGRRAAIDYQEESSAMDYTNIQIFLSEMIGTSMLTMLGCGVVANVLLPKTKGHVLDIAWWNLISWGWGFGVYAGIWAAWRTGAHLNPAVTVGIVVKGQEEFADGVPVT